MILKISVIFLMPYIVLLFGVIAFFHMLIFILQDAVNKRKIMVFISS